MVVVITVGEETVDADDGAMTLGIIIPHTRNPCSDWLIAVTYFALSPFIHNAFVENNIATGNIVPHQVTM